MANKRPKPEEIVTKLRQVDVLVGQGKTRIDAIRSIGVSEQTYYRWRKQYGGLKSDQAKRLKELEKVNAACQTEPGVQDLQRRSCTPADRTAQTMLP